MAAKNTAKATACAVQTSTGTTRRGWELTNSQDILKHLQYEYAPVCSQITRYTENFTRKTSAEAHFKCPPKKKSFFKESITSLSQTCTCKHVGSLMFHICHCFSVNESCRLHSSLGGGGALTEWEEWRTKWLNLSKVRQTPDSEELLKGTPRFNNTLCWEPRSNMRASQQHHRLSATPYSRLWLEKLWPAKNSSLRLNSVINESWQKCTEKSRGLFTWGGDSVLIGGFVAA